MNRKDNINHDPETDPFEEYTKATLQVNQQVLQLAVRYTGPLKKDKKKQLTFR